MSLQAGSQLGPYRIISQRGSGGMGAMDKRTLWTATDLIVGCLNDDEPMTNEPEPNIRSKAETGTIMTDDGQLYLVMAHYEGATLKDRISKGPLELDDAIDIAAQVRQRLATAHKASMVAAGKTTSCIVPDANSLDDNEYTRQIDRGYLCAKEVVREVLRAKFTEGVDIDDGS